MYSVTEAFVSHLLTLGYDAYANVPADPPTEFVTVERTGGSVTDLVDHPSIAVQCWAATDEAAERLANSVRAQIVTGTPRKGQGWLEHENSPAPITGPAARYDGNVRMFQNGYMGIVYTANYAAKVDNHRNNTLLKAKG